MITGHEILHILYMCIKVKRFTQLHFHAMHGKTLIDPMKCLLLHIHDLFFFLEEKGMKRQYKFLFNSIKFIITEKHDIGYSNWFHL